MANDWQSFIFGPGTENIGYPELQRRQAIATAIASQKRAFPKTFGEGLTYLGESIGDRVQEQRLAAAEAAFAKRNQANAEKFLGAGARDPAAPVAAPAPVAPIAPAAPIAPPAPVAPVKPVSVVPNSGAPPGDMLDPVPMSQQRDRIAAAVRQQQAAEQPQVQATPEVAQPNPTLPGATPPEQAEAFVPSPEQTPSTQQTSLGGPAADEPIRARRRAAIGGIESDVRGDPYSVVGKPTRGNYPLGRYQVMSNNLPEWSATALGREVSPQEFLGNKKIQDAIFDHRFGGYADKYGDEGAARAWYAGERGMNNPNATDRFGRLNVQQYGQDYLRRLRSDAGDTNGAPVQLASLGPGAGGTMTDVPTGPSLMPRTPGVTDEVDENPPTPTNIAPAPDAASIRTQLAQANRTIPGATQPTSDMFSPAPMMRSAATPAAAPAAAPSGPRGIEEPSRIAGATEQVYVAPKPEPVPPPKPVPMTKREAGAHALLASDPTNPYTKSIAEQVIQEETDKRKFEQDRVNTQYQADVRNYEQMVTAHQASKATQQERQLKLDAEIAAGKTRQAYGTLPEPIISHLNASKKEAEGSITALEAIRNAKVAIQAGTIFGLGAEQKLLYYKAKAFMGDQDAARIVAATENYPANLGGLIGQQIRQYGGTQISDNDRKYGARMSGGDITLNEQTAPRMLEIGEKYAQARVKDHGDLVKATLEGQPARLNEVYKVRDIVAPVPMTTATPRAPATSGGIPSFNSEAEVEHSGLPPGTKVIVNGRRATVK